MIAAAFKSTFNAKPVTDAADKAAFKNFGHAAARIAKDAKESIEKADEPSAPGTPPHTHRGSYLKRAIRFDATKERAVIGPRASIVGDVGEVHELGGQRGEQEYPERPFMGPALTKNLPRFASDWAGSIS